MSKKKDKNVDRFGNETVYMKNIADEAMDYNKLAGANKNVYRIAPSLNDGLKPGRRRLYWSWWEKCGKPQNTKPETMKRLEFMKVEAIASAAMTYHPHGSSANK
jgi:DNA gyrase/topoisomerase IV subunit A